MTLLSEFIYTRLTDTDGFKQVREDFLDIYANSYNIAEVKQKHNLADSQFQEHALTFWDRAPEFDPHEPIRKPVERLSNLYRLIKWVLGGLVFVSALFEVTVLNELSKLSFSLLKWSVGALIGSIPLAITSGIVVYLHLLTIDTELVQKLNSDLRVGPRRIKPRSRETERLFAFTIWNRSLTDSKKLPTVAFLYLIKWGSSNIYNRIVALLMENMHIFYEHDRLRDVIRVLYRKAR